GVVVLGLGVLLLGGCEQEGPAERAGKQVDEAVENLNKTVKPDGPVERAGEKVDEAVEAAGDKIKKAGDKIESATDH
ncbi:MAG: hypothetical protein AB7P69_27220, partial [Candidatus Binatia bacterium]